MAMVIFLLSHRSLRPGSTVYISCTPKARGEALQPEVTYAHARIIATVDGGSSSPCGLGFTSPDHYETWRKNETAI